MRDDLVPHTDSSMDSESSARQKFLLEEGLEMLARYRSIGDPRVRLMVRQLVGVIADGQIREQ